MENKRDLQIKAEYSFDSLREYLGKKINVDYFQFGSPYSEELILRGVNDYSNILVNFPGGKTTLNFVGYKSVIRQISSTDGKILYENKNVSEEDDFKIKSKKDLEDLFCSTFGFKGLSSLEPIVPHETVSANSKDKKPWYSRLDNWPRKEFFR